MNDTVETQIVNVEERLRLAMLASDVSVLNELIAPEITKLISEYSKRQCDRSNRRMVGDTAETTGLAIAIGVASGSIIELCCI
jgi:hypothetical protein